MKRFSVCAIASLMVASLLTATSALAVVITPVAATASSEGADQSPTNLINMSGMVPSGGPGELDDLHTNTPGAQTMWHVAGPGIFDPPPPFPHFVEFDLGGLFFLDAAHIWQMNQETLAPDRGTNRFEISVSPAAAGPFNLVGGFNLAAAGCAGDGPAQVIGGLGGVLAQRVRFDILSAHSGLNEEFVGLSEVRFEGRVIPEPAGALLLLLGVAAAAMRRVRG